MLTPSSWEALGNPPLPLLLLLDCEEQASKNNTSSAQCVCVCETEECLFLYCWKIRKVKKNGNIMNQLMLFLSSGCKSIYLCVCLYKSLCHDSVTWIKKYKDDNLRPLSRTATGLWLSLGLSVGERALQWLTERSRGSCFLLCEAGRALSALLSSSRRWGLRPCDSQYAGTALTVQRTSSEEFMQHSHIHEDSPHQIQLLLWSISFIFISFGLKTRKRKLQTQNTALKCKSAKY